FAPPFRTACAVSSSSMYFDGSGRPCCSANLISTMATGTCTGTKPVVLFDIAAILPKFCAVQGGDRCSQHRLSRPLSHIYDFNATADHLLTAHSRGCNVSGFGILPPG